MISFIIWVVGLVLAIMAALEIYRLEGDMIKKVLFIVLLLLTSWIGLAVYYLLARKEIANWVK
jgi:hypothetical protein